MQDESFANPMPAPGGPEKPVPRLYGVIDVRRTARIGGWAIDRADSGGAAEVDIFREGRLVQTIRADRYRGDLEKNGIGTGRYGFLADLDPPVEPGFEFTVTATARAADGSSAALKPVGAAAGSDSIELRLLQRLFELAVAAQQPPPEPQPQPVRDDSIGDSIARLQTVQARIEAAVARIETPPPAAPGRSLRLVVTFALFAAAGSLALGLYSLTQP